MSVKIIFSIIFIISQALYISIDSIILKLSFLFFISIYLIYTSLENIFFKKGSLVQAVLSLTLLVLNITLFTHKPFDVRAQVMQDEYTSYGKTSDGAIIKLPYKITVFEKDDITFIKLKDSDDFLIKKEYHDNLTTNNLKFKIISQKKHKTGNYIVYLKSNITNINFETIISNNGNIKLDNGIKIELLNTKNDKETGKAIQIKYNFPSSKREHKQWLYNKYKEFNMITSSDDPLTILYVGDETKNIYNIQIKYTLPYQMQIYILIAVLSLILLFLQLYKKRKNENKIL